MLHFVPRDTILFTVESEATGPIRRNGKYLEVGIYQKHISHKKLRSWQGTDMQYVLRELHWL